jgi:hypothetical protein
MRGVRHNMLSPINGNTEYTDGRLADIQEIAKQAGSVKIAAKGIFGMKRKINSDRGKTLMS